MDSSIQIQAPDGSVAHFPAGTPDDVIKSVMAKEYGAPKQEKGVVADIAKSAGIGLAKGGIGLAGLVGDLSNIGAKGIEHASNFVNDTLGLERYNRPEQPSILNRIPTADSLQKNVEGVTGEFYKPKTTAGEYAQTAGEFLPSLIGGPESIGAKLLTRVAIPSVASETAGQLTKGSALEPWARVAGGLAGGVASPKGFEYANGLRQGGADGISRGASRHLIEALSADGVPAVQGKMGQLGSDAMLADAGPAFLGKAQGAALNSDEGRSVLSNALTTRNEGTDKRIMGDVNRALGPVDEHNPMDPQTVSNAIRARRSEVDSRAYPAALSNAPDVQTAHILTYLDAAIPEAVGMEKKALTSARNMMMKTERQPRMDPDAPGRQAVDARGNPLFDEVKVSQNDANVLHKVKGELDNVIQYDAPGLDVPAGAVTRQQAALKGLRHELNQTLEDQVPGYAEANRQSAALAKRGEAVEAGTQYLGSGKTTPSPGRFAAEFDPLSQGEKIAFAKGSRGNIDRILGTKANDLQALRSELQGEGGWNTAKIATVHGQEAAAELAASVERNLKFRDTHNKVVENSQTAQRTAAARNMKPDASTETPLINPNMSFTGLPMTILKKGATAALNLVRPDPTKSFGEIAKVLSAQGPQRDAHLAALVEALSRKQANSKVGAGIAKNALISALLAETPPSNR